MQNQENYEQQQSSLNRHQQPTQINPNMYNIIYHHAAHANSGMMPNPGGATQFVHVSNSPHQIAFAPHPHPNFNQQQYHYFNQAALSAASTSAAMHQSQPQFHHSALQSPNSFTNNQSSLVVAAGSLNQQEDGSGSGSSSLNLSQASLPSISSSHGGLISQQSPRVASPLASNREPPRIIYWPELLSLLQNEPDESGTFALLTPEANVTARPNSGQLVGGQFFTPKSPRKDQYFLFASKSDYISHFVHYYFSTSNMRRDTTLQSLLIEGGCLPVERLLLFPKLSQIETSEEDLVIALDNSQKVIIVSLQDGRRAVKRTDNWSPTQSAGPSTPVIYDNNMTNFNSLGANNSMPNSAGSTPVINRVQLVSQISSPGQVPHAAAQFHQAPPVYAWHGAAGYIIQPTTSGEMPHPVHHQMLPSYAVPASASGSYIQQPHYQQHVIMGPPSSIHHHQGSGNGAAGLLHAQAGAMQDHRHASGPHSIVNSSMGHYHTNGGSISSQPPLHNWVHNH